MGQRIKGQEVSITIVTASVVEDELTEIVSFNCEPLLETKSQGYLGETTNRQDDIFNGFRFDMELHLKSQRWLAFQREIINRARRITPDTIFNITATLLFPNGDTPIIMAPDAKFGSTPMSIATRGDYVKVKLQGMAEENIETLS
jgi:hypothetical protein